MIKKTFHLFLFSFSFVFIANVYSQSSEYNVNRKDWIARGGCWTFSKNYIYGQVSYGYNKIYLNKNNFTNFVFEAEIKKISESGHFGLIFHYNPQSDEGYQLVFYPEAGLVLRSFAGEEIKGLSIGSSINLNFGINARNVFKIIGENGRFDFYVNNQFLSSTHDVTYSYGKLGFFLHGDPRQKAVFRVISIKEWNEE